MTEQVILVDENDLEIGLMPKLEAHQTGMLHRAFSVFIFNSAGEMLLQQRAFDKYHSGGLWSNTCCSHPRPGEKTSEAASRRLFEEMGLKCEICESFSFIYKAGLENGLTEYEFDHVFTGISDALPISDNCEVAGWAYQGKEMVENEIKFHPEKFTEWFKLCLNQWHNELFLKR